MPRSRTCANWPPAIAGRSAAARRLREDFLRATQAHARTLIVAAPGMEGSAVARAIHGANPPAPLIEIDCAAGDPASVERQLLGRASPVRNGRLEHVDAAAALVAARHGTCILHSVEELSYRAQSRLARVLRDGEIRVRPGGTVPLRARLIAVAGVSLETDDGGHLRADLRRRLGTVRLDLLPLSTRREDIPEILSVLTARIAAERSIPPRPFTRAAIALICALQWPDNVSGLAALVHALLDQGPEVVRVEEVLAHFGAPTQTSIAPHASLRDARRQFEHDYIVAVLRRFDGRVAPAARALGIQRTNLYRKARQLGIHGRERAH